LLGLVVERRGYGYELAQRFEQLVGPAYRVSGAAIYRALDALEREALVRGSWHARDRAFDRGRAAPRVVYEATRAGVEAYECWVSAPVRLEPLRSELVLKVACSRPEHAMSLLPVIDGYEKACLESLREQCALGDREVAAGTYGWRLSAVALVRERAVRLLNAEIEWVRDLRRAVVATRGAAGRGAHR
jgi:DNA-binding PadR family transcriptional regulator